jgi:uncharacterized protein
MKWTKRDLLRLPKEGYEETLELTFDIQDIPKYMGITRIEACLAHVKLTFDAYAKHIMLDLKLKGSMVVPCSISFEDVNLPFDIKSTQVYALEGEQDESSIDYLEDELDLNEACLSRIWLEIPTQVISPRLKTWPHGDGWEVLDEATYQKRKQSTIDPRLEKLLVYQPENEEEV